MKLSLRSMPGLLSLTVLLLTSCQKDVAPMLTISPEKVVFESMDSGQNTFTIHTQEPWKVVTTELGGISFTPANGVGEGVVTITDAPRNKTVKLTVIAGEGSNVVARDVEVTYNYVPKAYRWPELPANAVSSGDFVVGTHWTTTVTSKQHLRNFTFCYDVRRHCPVWVAHPQHVCYTEGSERKDTWARDPNLTHAQSAIMYPYTDVNTAARSLFSRADENPTLATNWPATLGSTEGIQWTRGHMLQSACRPGKGLEINLQTCYSTNIAPQKGKAFDKLWQAAEEKIRLTLVVADTLFYVSGAYFGDEGVKAKDGYSSTAKTYIDNVSKYCVVPTHYYKVLLRTKKGDTKKRIQDCAANELQAVAMWFTHTDTDPVSGSQSPTLGKEYLISVKELETKTGLAFFPDAPAAVKESFTAADWGF